MVLVTEDMIKELQTLMEQIDESLKITFTNIHQGYPRETLMRFLKAREGDVSKAHQMLLDCLNWRIQNEIDDILAKPIIPTNLYRSVRDSQLIGMSGFSKEGLPVIAIGVGLSTFDKASIHYYVQSHIQMNEYRDRVILPSATKKFGRHIGNCVKVLDMIGLKLSALNQIKLLSVISTIDDLNYPEKTNSCYIVNAPNEFSACWKVMRPLLQERTRNKVQVLPGCGKDELLKIMDYASLPHFCKRESSGSSRHSRNGTTDNCFSLDHAFHQQLYNYIKQQAGQMEAPIKQGSFHIDFPEPNPEDDNIAETIETAFKRIGDRNGLSNSLRELDSLNWRIQREIDDILAKPIILANLYGSVRDSQLIGMSGFSKEFKSCTRPSHPAPKRARFVVQTRPGVMMVDPAQLADQAELSGSSKGKGKMELGALTTSQEMMPPPADWVEDAPTSTPSSLFTDLDAATILLMRGISERHDKLQSDLRSKRQEAAQMRGEATQAEKTIADLTAELESLRKAVEQKDAELVQKGVELGEIASKAVQDYKESSELQELIAAECVNGFEAFRSAAAAEYPDRDFFRFEMVNDQSTSSQVPIGKGRNLEDEVNSCLADTTDSQLPPA